MTWFFDLITNPIIVAGVTAWLNAQVLKTIIYWVVNKKFDIWRLFGDGGMPSGHSATVTSIAMISTLIYGTGSFQFAISTMLAVIVCHDAMGVRQETGKQAKVLNEIMKSFDILSKDALPEVKLKEFVGHTPFQVFTGIIIGIVHGLIIYFLFFV
mgnify:FL=1